MGRLKYCKKCCKVVDFKEETIIENGLVIKYTTCENCGDRVKSSVNHVHYGEDGKR